MSQSPLCIRNLFYSRPISIVGGQFDLINASTAHQVGGTC